MNHDNTQVSLLQSDNDKPLPLIVAEKYRFPLQHIVTSDDKMLYAIQDWIAGLSGASLNSAQKTWGKMNSEFEIQSWSMPYKSTSGKTYQMDFTPDEGLYQIAQEMRAMAKRPQLQEIKDFLAKAGVLADLIRQNPQEAEQAIGEKRRRDALASGKSEAWITARELGIQARNQCTAAIVKANPQMNIGEATNTTYKNVLGQDAQGLRQALHIGQRQNPRDSMSLVALSYIQVAEAGIALQLEGFSDDDIVPIETVRKVVAVVTKTAGIQAQDMARVIGIDLVTGHKTLASGR